MKKYLKVFLVGLMFAPLVSLASVDKNLSYGSRGSAVTELQEFLIDQNFLQGTATGNFFSLTLKAVKAFQSAHNIPSTGYVGMLSRTEINTELAADLASSTQEQVAETGTTTINTSTSTNPLLTTLQQQNALLQQQLQAQQQTNVLLQNQQTTQQSRTTTTPIQTPTSITATSQSPALTSDDINKLTNSYKDFSVQFSLDKTQIINDGKDQINLTIKTLTKDGLSVQPYTSFNTCGVNVTDGSIISNGFNCNESGNVTGADGTWTFSSFTSPRNISVSPFKLRIILKSNPTQYFDSPEITVINSSSTPSVN